MRCRQGLAKFFSDESGQTLAFAMVCITTLVASLGLAIDVGHARFAKRQLQSAADAAALAAGLELRFCGTTNPCSTMAAAATDSLAKNGFTPSAMVYNCGTGSGALVVIINTPPCALGTADSNKGKTGYLEVQLQEKLTTYFARIVGFPTFNLSARAQVRRGGGPCIYALDTTGPGAITAAAALTTTCAIVDESTNSAALACLVGYLQAPQITVAGGDAGLLCGSQPAPRLYAPMPTPADPLKFLPPPAIPACGTSTSSPYHGSSTSLLPLTLSLGTFVLYPDKAYCGGINILLGATVTFMPGTYVIKSTSLLAAGLSISLLANVTGTGVTFYNYGPNGGLGMVGTGLSAVNLSAPTSGNYAGILYWQDAGDSYASTISASSVGTSVQGGFYLPSATLTYLLATPSPYTIIVAKDINFAAAINFLSNYGSLVNGSPLNSDNVILVE